MTTRDPALSILVVHGVFPPPDELLRPPMNAYGDASTGRVVAGWVVDPDGTATRVLAAAPDASTELEPFESLLDALGDIGAAA